MSELEQEYGDKLRIVYKHNPLPFHKRAEPAAQFAIEARAQGGDKKFWAAYDLLFANRRNLTDQDFERYAKTLGINAKLALDAVRSQKHALVIDEDWALAEDLNARGTPSSSSMEDV